MEPSWGPSVIVTTTITEELQSGDYYYVVDLDQLTTTQQWSLKWYSHQGVYIYERAQIWKLLQSSDFH